MSTPRIPFPRVKEAREALREKALEILESYLTVVSEARANKDYETAAKALQWLIEHMPAEDGLSIIDSSAAKPKEIEGPKGPSIQIGIQLGGTKQSEAKVIDVTPEARHLPLLSNDSSSKEDL